MTSRERVLRALNHQQPDRVPLDLGGNQTGIHKNAYASLIRHLGLSEEMTLLDPVQQLAQPSEAVLERLRIDTRYIRAEPGSAWKGGITMAVREGKLWHDLVDEFGVRWSMPEDAPYYMDITAHPLAKAGLAEVRDYAWPDGGDPARFCRLRTKALELRQNTPYAVVSGISGVVYETCWYLRGLEQWFCDLIERPEFCAAVLDQVLRFWMDWFCGFLDSVGDLVDVVMIGDDLAGQNGPLISLNVYRALVKPRQKRLVKYIRSRTQARIWYHTCGACTAFIPDLLDNGIHALNPVQISARDMEPPVLKRRYGKDLVFWGGGVDSQNVLPNGTPAEVAESVRLNVEAFKPGGGYVFCNVHNIQGEVSPANILAMYDSAFEAGHY